MVCREVNEHRFTTLEVPESVAAGIGAPWGLRVAEADRGVALRAAQYKTRQLIAAGLDAGDKFEVIAHGAGCSVSLVQKVAKARGVVRGRCPPLPAKTDAADRTDASVGRGRVLGVWAQLDRSGPDREPGEQPG